MAFRISHRFSREKRKTGKAFIPYLFFYSFIAFSLLAPIATDSYIINSADYINHLSATIQAKLALEEGQFPLRIAPFQLQGYRYPLFQFYSPTTYTLTGLIYKFITPSNPLIALKIILWLGLCVGGIFMQRLAFWLTRSKNAALLAGVTYLLAPYYILVVNYFGDVPEVFALGLVPAGIYYSLQLYLDRSNTTLHLLKVSAIWYGLITIHLITFFYTLIFSVIFFGIVTLKNFHHWKNFIRLLMAYGFALLLAAWHLGPIILLGNLLIITNTFIDPMTFAKAHTVISHLLFSSALSFGSLWDIHPTMGWIMMISFGVAVYASTQGLWLEKNRWANYWLPFLLILFAMVFFLVWTPFNIWQWIPKMFRVGQYNWRLLDQSLWIGALIFAWSVLWIFKNNLDRRHVILGTILIALMSNGWYHTKKDFGVPLDLYVKEPISIFNPSAYLIDTEFYPNLVNKIHGITLPFRNEKNYLVNDAKYIMTSQLLSLTQNPSIFIQGTVPDDIKPNSVIEFLIDDEPFKKVLLTPGKLQERIALQSLIPAIKDKNHTLKLRVPPDVTARIDEIYLDGFIPPVTFLDAKTVKTACQKTSKLACDLMVNPNVEFIELPMIYYPYLLKISLNGKKIAYDNILFDGALLATIKPIVGKNSITIEFIGLTWANWTSVLAWIFWGVLFLKIIRNTLNNRRLYKLK